MPHLNLPKRFLTVLLLSFLWANCFAQVEKAERDLREIMDKLDAVGLSVVVVKNGNVIYSNAFGLKDIESNTPLQGNDLFRIASISKSFSATSIMQLVEAKKLSLDDDLSDLVGFRARNPKYPEKVITLRMALSHTSSINDSEGYFTLDVINPEKNPDWAKCYSDYEPGSTYRYCNLNYNMIGTIIERTSGQRFDNYVKSHIIDPLGLNAGYCVDSLDNSLFATLYEYDSTATKYVPSPQAYAPRREEIKNYVLGYSTPIFSPTGGMKISAPDLARYMTMHMNMGKYKKTNIISKESAKLMQAKVTNEINYGFAIMTTDDLIPNKVMKGHTGSAYGLFSALFFHPEEKFGFVVITNGSHASYSNGMSTILRTTIGSLYDNFIK